MSKIQNILKSLKSNGLAATSSNVDCSGYALADVSGQYQNGFGSLRNTTERGLVAVEIYRVSSTGNWTKEVASITCKP